MPKGVPNKRYTPEFKKLVVETMQKENLRQHRTIEPQLCGVALKWLKIGREVVPSCSPSDRAETAANPFFRVSWIAASSTCSFVNIQFRGITVLLFI